MRRIYPIEFKIKNPDLQQTNAWGVWSQHTTEAEQKRMLKILREDWGNTYEFREAEGKNEQ